MRKKLQLLLTILSICLLRGYAQSATAGPEWSEFRLRQDVGVEGNHITMNGHPWQPRGVALQAFVRSQATLDCEHAAHPDDTVVSRMLTSLQNFGPAELEAIRRFHADSIRFVVSQAALDPDSGDDSGKCQLYDPNYLDDLTDAVRTARRAGFVVLLMMQHETDTAVRVNFPLPTEETERDWDLLASVFGRDRGVMFELYNEPNVVASAANWELWLNGGQFGGASYLGMQTLIDHLRGIGAENLFVLDGLAFEEQIPGTTPATTKPVREAAQTLENVPSVTDPLGRIVYAVHPYLHGIQDESHWEDNFGTPSRTIPVWADEWSAPTKLALGLGDLSSYQEAVDLLNFLRSHHIPLSTGSFDVPQWVVQDIPGWTLTNYRDYNSSSRTQGSGTLVYHLYADGYSRPLTLADGQ